MTDEQVPYVGYMSPPEHTRFKPGKSGNPRGRPRKPQTPNTVLKRVLDRKVPVKGEDGKMRIRDALIWRLRKLALEGDKQALALHRRILAETGAGEPERHPPIDQRARAQEILGILGLPINPPETSDDE